MQPILIAEQGSIDRRRHCQLIFEDTCDAGSVGEHVGG